MDQKEMVHWLYYQEIGGKSSGTVRKFLKFLEQLGRKKSQAAPPKGWFNMVYRPPEEAGSIQ